MADKQNAFKAMMAARQGNPPAEDEAPVEEVVEEPVEEAQEESPPPQPKESGKRSGPKTVEAETTEPVKPAKPLSKRQDPEWFTRTYYLKKATDLEIETELLALRREGVEMDKSDLVEALLSSWVEYRRGMAPAAAWKRVSGKRED